MNQVVRVTSRADGIPDSGNFQVSQESDPACPAGGCLVQVIYATVDPAMRGWLSRERNYLTVANGEIMRAHGIGHVIESRSDTYHEGDVVYGWLGWQHIAAVADADLLWKAHLDEAPAEYWLSALGLNGLTAWVGLRHLARVRAHDKVLVTTCAGGVGSIVGQLAQASDAQVVGLTGDDTKAALAVAEFGYDRAINYKTAPNLAEIIAETCPTGIDLFFDNTAGAIADAVFPSLNVAARVIQCGTAAVASWLPVPQGPRRERDILARRLSWHGLVVFDHHGLFPRAMAEMKDMIARDGLRIRHEIIEGLHLAPTAISQLYNGQNLGRMIIRP